MEPQLAIFELIAVVIAPPLTVFFGWFIKRFFSHSLQDELNHSFHKYWDGRPENERYAWQMVKRQILNTTRNEEKLKRIDQILANMHGFRYASSLKVDQEGRVTTPLKSDSSSSRPKSQDDDLQ